MDSELVQTVRKAYAAFERRDVDAIAELCDPEFEFTSLIQESEGTVYRGYDGLEQFMNSLVDVLPDWAPEIAEIEERGDRMLVKARTRATPRGGSVPIELTGWQAIWFRDGLALRWDWFRTEEEARAALRSGPA